LITKVCAKVVLKLGLSFRTVKQLNEIIDSLPGRPSFQSKVYEIGGKEPTFYYWDIVPCLQALYSDPAFKDDLIFAPERHYTTEERTCRIYNEMHTGDWWWSVQVCSRKPSWNWVSNMCPRPLLSHKDQARPSYPSFCPPTKPNWCCSVTRWPIQSTSLLRSWYLPNEPVTYKTDNWSHAQKVTCHPHHVTKMRASRSLSIKRWMYDSTIWWLLSVYLCVLDWI